MSFNVRLSSGKVVPYKVSMRLDGRPLGYVNGRPLLGGFVVEKD